MYLSGDEYVSEDWKNPANNIVENGYRLKGKRFDLGYWRKHPDLHGYIVENFANGVDECQPIDLSGDAIGQIVIAISEDRLPHTEGFFFGQSENDEEQRNEAVAILSRALKWLETDPWHRSITYQASW
ncbi:MAG: hypothetical protein ABIS50_03830 [Luteolibacter sp.]|uniref:hypothetical protein n=1 Tax=Luteolibacter sp. TaxID=1962973 RepID=UPI003265ADC2